MWSMVLLFYRLLLQLIECLASSGVILPQDGEGGALGDLHGGCLAEVLFTGGSELALQLAELATGTEDGLGAAPLSLHEEHGGGYIVEQATHEEYATQVALGEVLIEHQQVVAEVEEGLARMPGIEGGATHMMHHACCHTAHLVATTAEAPAEVYLFHVGKETAVEAAYLFIYSEAHDKAGTRGPQEGYIGVVLAVVFLYRVEDAATAVGVSIAVEEAAHGTGILELVLVMIGHELGLACSCMGVGIHVLYERKEPTGSDLYVGVEQHGILGINLLEGVVIAIGNAVVMVENDGAHRGERIGKQSQRTVGRAIVGDIHHGLAHGGGQHGMLHHGGEKLTEHLLTIPVENYDCDFHELKIKN